MSSPRLVVALFLSVTIAPFSLSAGSLKFTAEVPKPPAELPLLKLTPQSAPVDLMNRLLASSGKSEKVEPLDQSPFFRRNRIKMSNDVVGVVEGEHVKAWVDKATGDAAIYPSLSTLKPISRTDVEKLASQSREIFESAEFIARDDTRFVMDKPQILNGATLARGKDGATRMEKPAASYVAYVAARRQVADLPVDGPGSRAVVGVGNGGSVEALTRVWKSAKTVEQVRASQDATEIKNEIARQLEPAVKTSDVVIDRIELAYYDSNREFLQPVYRFTAQVHHLTEKKTPTDDDFVIGYIPFAKAFEPLPSLDRIEGPSPKNAVPYSKGATPHQTEIDPIVGRYVVRNDDAGWVNDANAFWNSLSSAPTGSLFTNSQYYWAETRLFTNQKNSFINAMNVALIEVHGDWWLYSTLKNCCDLVNINGDIPNPGYGPSAGGKLADWIIHSCEVIPAPDDTANWPAPWWTIFGGVRNVVGYRTIMYISDGAGDPFGTSLGHVAPVVGAWLNDVISLSAYSGHPTAKAHGGITRPMGRPATISMAGHENDSVFATSTLGRANTLVVWWFPD